MKIMIKKGYKVLEFSGEFQVIDVSRITEDQESFNCVATLNETGLELWVLIEKGNNLKNLVEYLSKRNQMDEEDAWQDVTEFVAKMKNAGAIELI